MSMSTNTTNNILSSLNKLGGKITETNVNERTNIDALNYIASAVTQKECNEKSFNDAITFLADNYTKTSGGGIEDVTELPLVGEEGKIYRLTAVRLPDYSDKLGAWFVPKIKRTSTDVGFGYLDGAYRNSRRGGASSLDESKSIGTITVTQGAPAWTYQSGGTKYNFIGSLVDGYFNLNNIFLVFTKQGTYPSQADLMEYSKKMAAPCCYTYPEEKNTFVEKDEAKEIALYSWSAAENKYTKIGIEHAPKFKHTIISTDPDIPSVYFINDNPYGYITELLNDKTSSYAIPAGTAVFNDEITTINVGGTSYPIRNMEYGYLGTFLYLKVIYYDSATKKYGIVSKNISGLEAYDIVSIVE